MSQELRRRFDLWVLQISIAREGDGDSETNSHRTSWGSEVVLELEGRVDGTQTKLASRRVPLTDIGIPERLERQQTLGEGLRFRLDPEVIEEIRGTFAAHEAEDRVLWIHLVKPYGYLALVPWEQLLQKQLLMPILRLPDVLVEPIHGSDGRLDVVICSSVPVSKDHFSLIDVIPNLVRILEHSISRSRVRVHIFTDSQFYSNLRHRFSEWATGDGIVRLYDPAFADSYATAPRSSRLRTHAGSVENPWLLWMRDALRGQSIDVVHFVTHGYMARDQGALALAESPTENEDRRMARFIAAEELQVFSAQIGAWAAVFTSPLNNYSEMGLRMLADRLAQLCPGPVLHHELRLDPELEVLAAAERFLIGPANAPPASPAVLMYCHPSLLPETAARRTAAEAESVESSTLNAAISDLWSSEGEVPTWIAASQRYVQKQTMELGSLARRSDVTGRRSNEIDELRDTLSKIQEVVATFANSDRGGRSG